MIYLSNISCFYFKSGDTFTAEAYPGKYLVLHMSAQVIYYVIDYILYFLIRRKGSDNVRAIHNIPHQLIPKSYGAVTWYVLILMMMAANIGICIETIFTATARFDIKGVLSFFVPDSIKSNSLLELGNALTSTSMVDMNYAYFLLVVFYLSIVIAPIMVNALIFVIWILPFCAAFHSKIVDRLLELMWLLQAWNGLDALWLISWGLLWTEQTTKYMIDNILPHQCGAGNIVEKITGEDCAYITSTYTYGMGLLTVTVLLNHCFILWTEYRFGRKMVRSKEPVPILRD